MPDDKRADASAPVVLGEARQDAETRGETQNARTGIDSVRSGEYVCAASVPYRQEGVSTFRHSATLHGGGVAVADIPQEAVCM